MNGKFGVVNKKGQIVIEPTLQIKLNFDMLQEFGLTTISKNYKEGAINGEMKTVLSAKYDKIRIVNVYGETYMVVNLKEGIGLFNATGNSISKKIFSIWKQDESGDLLLFDDFNWFRLTEDKELEEI
jgi:hypothetical protein